MIRKVFTLILVALVLTACVKPAPLDSEPEIEQRELSISVYRTMARQPLDEVIRSFEAKNPGVTVRVRELTDLLLPTVETVTEGMVEEWFGAVDVIVGPDYIGDWLARHRHLLDLTNLPLPELDPVVVEFATEYGTTFGRRFHVPLAVQPELFMVNEQALTQLGIAPPTNDWTYVDLAHILSQLAAAEQQHRVALFPIHLVDAAIDAYGGDFYDHADRRWDLDTAETRAALAYVQDLYTGGLLKSAGRIIVVPDEPDAALLLAADRTLPGYRAVPYPLGPVRRNTPKLRGMGAMVLKSTVAPELATAFLLELLGPEEGATAFAKAGVRPLVYAPEAQRVWRERVGEGYAGAYDIALQSYVVRPTPPVAREIVTAELWEGLESGRPVEHLLVEVESWLSTFR